MMSKARIANKITYHLPTWPVGGTWISGPTREATRLRRLAV
jgi:hypothetical protein